VNPHFFDRWSHGFIEFGREEYIFGRGVFESVGNGNEAAALRELERAETALADEWSFFVEAGIRF
jgi:hypothetical protein